MIFYHVACKNTYRQILADPELLDGVIKQDPEKIFLLSAGYEVYQAKLKEPEGVGGERDCEDNTVRNIVTLLTPQKNGLIDIAFLKTRFPNLDQKLIDFFAQYPSSAPDTSQIAHDIWSDIAHTGGGGGLKSLVGTIARLTHDDELSKPWGKLEGDDLQREEEKRMAYFLTKISTNTRSLSLQTHEASDGDYRKYSGTFLINGEPAYNLEIEKHWGLDRIAATGDAAWKKQYVHNTWPNEWISSLFPSPALNKKDLVANVCRSNPKNYDEFYSALKIIFEHDLEAFYPLLVNWVLHVEATPDQEKNIIRTLYQYTAHLDNQHISQLKISKINLISVELMCEFGDIPSLQKAIVHHPDVFQNSDQLLGIAVEHKQLPVVQFLLEHHANVDAKIGHMYDKKPALIWAVENGDIVLAKLLLDHKATIDQKDSYNRTPLCLAVQGGHIELVKLLLNYKADVNQKEPFSGGTVLISAVSQVLRNGNNMDLVNLLLEYHADVNVENSEGLTGLDYAEASGNLALMKRLSNGLDQHHSTLFDENKINKTIHLMVEFGNVTGLQKAIKEHPDVVKNLSGLLHKAVENNHINIVQFLLENNVNIDERLGRRKNTALILAVKSGNIDLVKLLLAHHANIELEDDYNRTAISYAKNNPDILQLLKSHVSSSQQ